jgi:hypothetical protein
MSYSLEALDHHHKEPWKDDISHEKGLAVITTFNELGSQFCPFYKVL